MSDGIRLILMSCCAPCSCGAIKQLVYGEIPGIDDFIVMFFNPNIYPETEYQKRLNEQIKYCEKMGAKYVVGDYDHDAWRKCVSGLENEPERGARCSKCFAFRFCRAREYAKKHGFNAIASVFGVSRFKSQIQVDTAAESVCTDIKYLPIKWDESLRVSINRESDFYRQNYCGCEFSMRK
jgi:hypothetical protein